VRGTEFVTKGHQLTFLKFKSASKVFNQILFCHAVIVHL